MTEMWIVMEKNTLMGSPLKVRPATRKALLLGLSPRRMSQKQAHDLFVSRKCILYFLSLCSNLLLDSFSLDPGADQGQSPEGSDSWVQRSLKSFFFLTLWPFMQLSAWPSTRPVHLHRRVRGHGRGQEDDLCWLIRQLCFFASSWSTCIKLPEFASCGQGLLIAF